MELYQRVEIGMSMREVTMRSVVNENTGCSWKRPVMISSEIIPRNMDRRLRIGDDYSSPFEFLFYAIQDGRLCWDNRKNNSNEEGRDLGFKRVYDVQFPPVIRLFMYIKHNEHRCSQHVYLDEEFHFLTYTIREEYVRIISLRRESTRYKRKFEQKASRYLRSLWLEYYLVSSRL